MDVTLKSDSKILSDEIPTNFDPPKKVKGGLLRNSSALKRISRTFKMFNLRTGKMEKFSGFAFSQESGAGRTIPTEEDLILQVNARN